MTTKNAGNPAARAAQLAGGPSALARMAGVSHPVAHEWIADGRPIPVLRCVRIEQGLDGQVTRRELRPDDWWLIWPELVTEDHPMPAGEAA